MERQAIANSATTILSNSDFEEAEEHIKAALELVMPYRSSLHKGKECDAQRRLDSMIKSLSSAAFASSSVRLGRKCCFFRKKYYASVTDLDGLPIGICDNPDELSTLLHIPKKKAYWMFANRVPGSEKAGSKAFKNYQITLLRAEN